MKGEAVLSTRDLCAGYGDRMVIHHADLDLVPGEVVALLGPNGIGKTTLIRALTGALKPEGGTLTLYGRDMSRMSPKAVARKVARVVQSPGSAWSFSVSHAVNLGRWPHHGWLRAPGPEDRRIAEMAMEEMEVLHLADRDFSTLSGGEAQRVMIAQALAQEPSVLIMDEPVAHLDLHHQVSTLDLVRRLSDRGIAILASLHDINLAAMYAHRVVMIDREGHVHSGPVSEMLQADRIEELFGLKLLPLRSEQHGTDYLMPMPAHLAACF